MSENRLFFHIEIENIPKNSPLLPFHIYLFNKVSHDYTFFHKNGQIFNEDKYQELEKIYNKGGIIAISMQNKKSFLKASGLEESDIKDLRSNEEHQLVVEHTELLKNNTSIFKAMDSLHSTLETEDFYTLITEVKNQILLFDVRISQTTSLCRDLAKKIMFDDTPNNRITALCFCLTKILNITNTDDIAKIVCASFLHHIGFLLMDYSYYFELKTAIPSKNFAQYTKHPALAQHVIRRSGIDVSEECLRIIQQHHERSDGTGFPYGLKEDKIDQLSFILGACSHFIEFSINQKISLKQILEYQKKGVFLSGLEFKFGDIMKKGIDTLI